MAVQASSYMNIEFLGPTVELLAHGPAAHDQPAGDYVHREPHDYNNKLSAGCSFIYTSEGCFDFFPKGEVNGQGKVTDDTVDVGIDRPTPTLADGTFGQINSASLDRQKTTVKTTVQPTPKPSRASLYPVRIRNPNPKYIKPRSRSPRRDVHSLHRNLRPNFRRRGTPRPQRLPRLPVPPWHP